MYVSTLRRWGRRLLVPLAALAVCGGGVAAVGAVGQVGQTTDINGCISYANYIIDNHAPLHVLSEGDAAVYYGVPDENGAASGDVTWCAMAFANQALVLQAIAAVQLHPMSQTRACRQLVIWRNDNAFRGVDVLCMAGVMLKNVDLGNYVPYNYAHCLELAISASEYPRFGLNIDPGLHGIPGDRVVYLTWSDDPSGIMSSAPGCYGDFVGQP